MSELDAMIKGSRSRREPLPHLLLTGPKGLGKTSLTRLAAQQCSGELIEVEGHTLRSPADAIALLASVPAGGFLFVDEVHRLPQPVEEAFYKPLEEGAAYLLDGHGGSRRLELSPMTVIGATTASGRLSGPLRDRMVELAFDWYTDDALAQIVAVAARKLGLDLAGMAAHDIATHGRGTPRQCIQLLKRVRDYADGTVRSDAVAQALKALRIFPLGLNVKDMAYIRALALANDQALGVRNLAARLSEDVETLENEIEPFLLAQGLIDLSSAGRVLTAAGSRYLAGLGD